MDLVDANFRAAVAYSQSRDHDRIHEALYQDASDTFCMARSRLIRAIMNQRSCGMLPNDTFDSIVLAVANPASRSSVFLFFGVALPEDLACC